MLIVVLRHWLVVTMRIDRNTNNITARFHPYLEVYLTADYKETDVIDGEIHSPRLLRQDLALLRDDTTNYILSVDGTGQYHIKQVSTLEENYRAEEA